MLKVGSIVMHETHGMGIVTEVWGVFLSCRQCFKPVTSHGDTDCCGVEPAIIGGKGIFDVEFGDGKTRSIHQRLLTPVVGSPKYTRSKKDPAPEETTEDILARVICGLPLP